MKKIVSGIVAHVDAGTTTLSEALLYNSGSLRKLGRVDKGDAFLDTDDLEKKRGITIFSHQASLEFQDLQLTMLDTPGHMDFAAQTEQVLTVLDYAILVISATDGIQCQTRTLWDLLQTYSVPTFIFVNKMDADGVDKTQVLNQLQAELSEGCLDFTDLNSDTKETMAMLDDQVFDDYLKTENLSDDTVKWMISQRKVFSCYFGSALKLSGIDEFLAGLKTWTDQVKSEPELGLKVFKISHDSKGERLTWIRMTGGSLKAKDVLYHNQKINQIRVYDGAKFTLESQVETGDVCALTGLTDTYPGLGIGKEKNQSAPKIRPVLNYAVDPQGNDIHQCLTAFKILEDEDPQLHVIWSEHLNEIRVQIMGKVQLETLQQIMLERFKLTIGFDKGKILYQETITDSVEGVGYFEPLRHYAEVHLLLETQPAGTGLVYDSQCSLDILSSNWQHQVMTNLQSKEQLGVLIGAPITDMKITLINGKGSNVHSVGGDFKEATWRAIRQGLMMLKAKDQCQLLEPFYAFRLTVNQDQVGRAMNDIQKMKVTFQDPISSQNSEFVILSGSAPVAQMQDYAQEVRAYTHGMGNLECIIEGYRPCHNQAEVISENNYHPVADLENTPDSVFCAHGAGYPVAWDKVPEMAHVSYLK